MSAGNTWRRVTLYDFNGNLLAHVRVPTYPRQPGILHYMNRYFKQRGITAEYIEAAFFLVPMGGHYHSEDHDYGERAPGAAK